MTCAVQLLGGIFVIKLLVNHSSHIFLLSMIMCKKLHLDSSITININLKHSSNVARKDFFLSQCLSPTRSKKQVLANRQGKLIKCWGNLGWTSIPSRGGVGGEYL